LPALAAPIVSKLFPYSTFAPGPMTLSPLAFYKKRVTDFLAEHQPQTTFEQAITQRTIQAAAAGLLPSTLPYRTVSVNQELTALPDTLRHHVRFVAQGDGAAAFDDAARLRARRARVTVDVPANVEDQTPPARISIDNTPAYLQLRPVLKVGGR
jgi:hypothetical protein